MGKQKTRKYIAKPKAIKIASYFNKQELDLIKFVSNELLHVNERQFVKGAAIEMANASLNLAQEKANAEGAEEGSVQETDAASGGEQPSSEGGETATSSESLGEQEGST